MTFVVKTSIHGMKCFFALSRSGLAEWTSDEKDAFKFDDAARAIGVVNEFGGYIEPYPPSPAKKVDSTP